MNPHQLGTKVPEVSLDPPFVPGKMDEHGCFRTLFVCFVALFLTRVMSHFLVAMPFVARVLFARFVGSSSPECREVARFR